MNTRVATGRGLILAEKVILGFIAGAAAAIGVVEAVFLGLRIAELVGSPTTTLHDVPLVEQIPAGFAGTALASAEYEQVTLTVDGLPGGGIAALVGAAVLTAAVTIAVCAAVAWLCLRIFLGKPFVRSATWGIGAVAILVIVAGMFAPLLVGIAQAEAQTLTGLTEIPEFLFVLDPAPIGWGVALAVVAGAFEIGQRLQRDTEGLV